MRPGGRVLSILAADIHLTAKAPIARSAEPDWFAAMRRSLDELGRLAMLANGPLSPNVPVIYPGDIFDRWNPSPEVINFALQYLPWGYAVPGQHDLPHHRYEAIERSAYWTLVKSGKIINLPKRTPVHISPELTLHGFPWGSRVRPNRRTHELDQSVHLAVIHQYVWSKRKPGSGYPGVSEDYELGSMQRQLQGYDCAAFGDNHQGFLFSRKSEQGMSVLNCGTFFRRKSDEREYKPSVGLLREDGSVIRHFLDCSEDQWLDLDPSDVRELEGFSDLLRELGSLGEGGLNWLEAVKVAAKDPTVPPRVKRMIWEILDLPENKRGQRK